MEIIYDASAEFSFATDLYEISEVLDRFTAIATVEINYISEEPYYIIMEQA